MTFVRFVVTWYSRFTQQLSIGAKFAHAAKIRKHSTAEFGAFLNQKLFTPRLRVSVVLSQSFCFTAKPEDPSSKAAVDSCAWRCSLSIAWLKCVEHRLRIKSQPQQACDHHRHHEALPAASGRQVAKRAVFGP